MTGETSPEAAAPARGRLLTELFGVDLRSLAVFRMAVAGAILFDLATRVTHLVAHYTDSGALPVESVRLLYGGAVQASPFYHASGSALAVALLFALAAASAVALLLGWHSRVAALASWALLVSLQVRNPLLASMGGDKFLRVILFWGLFLPLGARWSLDAARGRSVPPGANRLLSVATFALLMQVCLMYWVTGIKKTGVTWVDGSAVHYALHTDYFATSLGVWLRERQSVLPFLTWGTRWFEILGPFLAFVPVWTGPVRTLAILAFAGFHLSLAACLNIGLFPLFSMVAWTAFLPSWFWDRLLPRLLPRRAGATEPPRFLTTPPAVQVVTGVLLTYVVLSLGAQLRWVGDPPAWSHGVAKALRIQQDWRMFTPDPPRKDLWPVFYGSLASGRSVDPLSGGPVLSERPALVSAAYPDFRWRLYLSQLMRRPVGSPEFDLLYGRLAEHLCRAWNGSAAGADRLNRIGVEYWEEPTLATGNGALNHELVFQRDCRG